MHISINKKEGEIMEKTVILFAFVFVMCSSIICHGQNDDIPSKTRKQELRKLEENENFLYSSAYTSQPLMLHDTLGADSIELKFYPNGQLYSLKPYEKGKIHGVWYTYNSNGTLKSNVVFEHGHPKDSIQIEYDMFGYIRQISFNIKSLGKWYQCLTYCFYGKPSVLHVRINADQYSSKMVSEYSYDDKNDNWYINGYHTNPPKITAKRLLRAYLKIYKRNNLSCKIETTKILKGIDYL